jgi:hypothetical protein
MEVPMLEEDEWQEVLPALREGIMQIKKYRQAHESSSVADAQRHVYGGALQRYFELTGFRETNANARWHHRLSLFGPPCRVCGKSLRTPRAQLCAECGTLRESDPEKG